MPRKQPAASTQDPAAKAGKSDEPPHSYLDAFLTAATETVNLPADVKRNIAQIRDLDTRAQELYERVQKQSKNHIARAKRSVQGGHSPDEDLLLKAQKSSRELLEVDSEKVDVADQLYGEL